MKLSIILPVRDEAAVIPELVRRLTSVLDGLDGEWEVVLVDDGSRDSSWDLLQAAADLDARIRAIRFSRNFGHQIALSAGLHMATGDAVITMDSDLQHPPELIPSLLARAGEGFDVVYAVRSSADSGSWFKRASARSFYRLLNRLSSLDIPQSGGDFRYMSRRVVDALLAMPERNRFLRGMTRWVGFEQSTIDYQRPPRAGGESKYTLRKMLGLAWDGVVSFSSLPLRVASVLGFAFSFFGLVYLTYVVATRVFTDNAVAGWTSVVATVLVLGGVQLLCIGIIGQYLGRMYEEMKGRPLFLVADDTARHEALELSETGESSPRR
ncbi:MAG: glycosyltransferase family 2 protein [Actinomycetota bacterium]